MAAFPCVISWKSACHVIQPDLTHCSGFSEARRIAALAKLIEDLPWLLTILKGR